MKFTLSTINSPQKVFKSSTKGKTEMLSVMIVIESKVILPRMRSIGALTHGADEYWDHEKLASLIKALAEEIHHVKR